MAPLLCAGLIGWRSLVMTGSAKTVGVYGFGAAGHIILQVARWQGRRVFVFTKPGTRPRRISRARSAPNGWADQMRRRPPRSMRHPLCSAGELVPLALKAVAKGGRVVCGGIHMSDIPSFPYRLIWGERQVVSVANLTRLDAREFLTVAAKAGIETRVTCYPLDAANQALEDLRAGRLTGSAVLIP